MAAGGRYDGLIKLLGGEDTKASGGALGIERVISLIKEKEIKVPSEPSPVIFLAQLGQAPKRKGLKLLEEFRKARIPVAEALGKDSLKAQFKMADKLGVSYTLLLGQRESLEGTIILRDMKTGKQETIKMERVVKEIKRRLK